MRSEFESVLDTCLDGILVKGDSIEQCLERYPEHAAELEPVLKAAWRVREASAIDPRPEFERAAKARLLTSLGGKAAGTDKKRLLSWRWQRRWAVALVAVLALLLSGGGTVAASSDSLPGDLLYPVKTATEKVQTFFTFGKDARASRYIQVAERRLRELELLSEKDRPIPATLLSMMQSETERAVNMLREGQATKQELLSRLVVLTSNQKTVLVGVIEKAPPEAKWRFRAALESFQRLERSIQGLERLREVPALNSIEREMLVPQFDRWQ